MNEAKEKLESKGGLWLHQSGQLTKVLDQTSEDLCLLSPRILFPHLPSRKGALSSVKKQEGKQSHWLFCKAVRILLKLLPKLLGKIIELYLRRKWYLR